MTRRIDTDLRSSISNLEEMVLLEPSTEDVLQKALAQLLGLLDCNYGFAFRCLEGNDLQAIPWQFGGSLQLIDGHYQESKALSTSSQIPPELITNMISGRSWYSHDPTNNSLVLPSEHPEIHNFYAIPLTDAKNVYGLLVACNSNQEFSDQTNTRLRPFIAAANCLLRASYKKTRFQNLSLKCRSLPSVPDYLPQMLDSFFNAVLVADDNDIVVQKSSAHRRAAAVSEKFFSAQGNTITQAAIILKDIYGRKEVARSYEIPGTLAAKCSKYTNQKTA